MDTISENSLLLHLTGDLPLFRIIDFLLENKGLDFSKTEVAQGAGISRASLFNYWSELEKHGLIRITRSFGKTRLYTLNSKNIITQKIIDLERALIAEALNKTHDKKEVRKEEELMVRAS